MAQDRTSPGAAAPRAARPALAALAGAWLHGWAQRPDPRPTWQDAAILAGLLAGWLLGRERPPRPQ